jgi:hypothetical protein
MMAEGNGHGFSFRRSAPTCKVYTLYLTFVQGFSYHSSFFTGVAPKIWFKLLVLANFAYFFCNLVATLLIMAEIFASKHGYR